MAEPQITAVGESDLAPLLPCDQCPQRAVVIAITGLPGVVGEFGRNWIACCGEHKIGRSNVLILGVTSVVRGG